MKSFNRREHEVWEACDLLLTEYAHEDDRLSKITGHQIMNKLLELGYKRGNNNQLYQYRNSWLTHRNLSHQNSSNETPLLNDRILSAVKAVHSAINQESEEQINSIREQCRREVEEITSSKRRVDESYGSLKHEFLKLEVQFNDLNEKFADLEISNRNLQALYSSNLTDHKSLEREYETYKTDMQRKLEELQTIYQDSRIQHKEEVDRIILQNKLALESQALSNEQQKMELKIELKNCLSQYEVKSEQFLQEKSKTNELQEKLNKMNNLNIEYEESIEITTEENILLRNELNEYKYVQSKKITVLETELQIRDTKLTENERLLKVLQHSNHIIEQHNGELLKQLQMLQSHNQYLESKIKRDKAGKKAKKTVEIV